MSRSDSPTSDAVVRLSPSLTVVLTASGPRIPVMGDKKPIDLEWPDLELLLALTANTADTELELLARVADTTGTPIERLTGLLAKLRDRNRLRDRPDRNAEHVVGRHPGTTRKARVFDEPGTDQRFVLLTPIHVLPTEHGYSFYDHHGDCRATLDSRELVAASEYRWPVTIDTAYSNQLDELASRALSLEELLALTLQLRTAEVLIETHPEGSTLNGTQGRDQLIGIQEFSRLRKLVEVCEAEANDRALDRMSRRSPSAAPKPFVIPYHKVHDTPPIALGMIVANALHHDSGSLRSIYEFEPNWVARKPAMRSLLAESPAVVLFSSYVWSHPDNLTVSELVKRVSPDSVTVHGGPDVPSRPAHAEAYLRENPHIDILVRGEGEHAVVDILEALDGRLTGRGGRLDGLEDIPGLTFRQEGELVRTADRERIADLDALPSPYLSGLFDPFGASTMTAVILESNRGCPYGCTFCDWGSATRSRIRKFSLDRVFAELEWVSKHRMPRQFIADANFGILPRDVEIARHIAAMRAKYGYPLDFGTNFAKNTTRHLKEIVQTLADAGVIADGLVSLQTTDPNTLDIVRRSNIKVDQYEELARTFREAGLPFFVDLMMGMPGATTTSFRADLQHCIDREVPAKIYRTEMLVNSPMNDPEYRAEHKIETEARHGEHIQRPRPLLVSTASYTRQDFLVMNDLRTTFLVSENNAVLRLVSRFLRHEIGLPESTFYAELDRRVRDEPDEYPFLSWGIETLPSLMLPPPSWALFHADCERYVVQQLGLAPSSALTAVLTAQRAILPSRGRTFPEHHALDHDVVGWMQDIVAAKDNQTEDWTKVVTRLGERPPGMIEISDPTDACTGGVGFHIDSDLYAAWELTSPIARSQSARHTVIG